MCCVRRLGDKCAVSEQHAVRNRHGFARELLVIASGKCQGRRGQGAKFGREPRLGTGARMTQRVRESARVTTARRALARVIGQRREHWLGQPFVKERLGPNGLNSICQVVVTTSPFATLGWILDASRRAEQHETSKSLSVTQREMQRHTRTVGIATEHERLLGKGVREQISRLGERRTN